MSETIYLKPGFNEITVEQGNNIGSFTSKINISANGLNTGDRGYVQIKTNPTQISNQSIVSVPLTVNRNTVLTTNKEFKYLDGDVIRSNNGIPVENTSNNFIIDSANIVTTTDTDLELIWKNASGTEQTYIVPKSSDNIINPDVNVNTSQFNPNGDPIAPNTYYVTAIPAIKTKQLTIEDVNLSPTIKDHTYDGRSDYIYVVRKVFKTITNTTGNGVCHYVPYYAPFETIKSLINNRTARFCEHIDHAASLPADSNNNKSNPESQSNLKYAYGLVVNFTVDDRFTIVVPQTEQLLPVLCDIEYSLDEFNSIKVMNMWQSLERNDETSAYDVQYNNDSLCNLIVTQKDLDLVTLSTNDSFYIMDTQNIKDKFKLDNVAPIPKKFYVRRNIACFRDNLTSKKIYSVKSYNTFRFKGVDQEFVCAPYFNVKGLAYVSIYIAQITQRKTEKLGCELTWNENCGGDYIAPKQGKQFRCYEFTVMPNGKNNSNRLVLSDINNKSDEMVALYDSTFGIISTSNDANPDPSTYRYINCSIRKKLYTEDVADPCGLTYRLNANPNVIIKFKSKTTLNNNFEVDSITFNMKGLENMIKFRIVNRLSAFDVTLSSDNVVNSNNNSAYLTLTNIDDICDSHTTRSCLHQSLNPSVWDSILDWDHDDETKDGTMNIYL